MAEEKARELLPQVEVDEAALVQLVMQGLQGTSFVSFEAVTAVKLTAEGKCLFGSVTKVARVNVPLNAEYQAAVNKRREREGLEKDFVPGARRNHTRPVVGLPFAVGNPENDGGRPHLYMVIVLPRSLEYTYFDAEGKVRSHEEVNPHIYRSPNAFRNQGLPKGEEVRYCTYDVQNLRHLTIGGIKV
jgi:hypothetical protein